jgi:ribosome assembly protein 4
MEKKTKRTKINEEEEVEHVKKVADAKEDPKRKALKVEEEKTEQTEEVAETTTPQPNYKEEKKEEEPSQYTIMFQNAEGEAVGDQIAIDSRTTRRNLVSLLNKLLENEEKMPYSLYIGDETQQAEVTSSILDAVKDLPKAQYNAETVIPVIYKPEAMFRVRPVTRASTTLEGHTEAILATCFSPDGKNLATGGGDCTVRIWDIYTETPHHTLEGHKDWVFFVSFSPDCKRLASGGKDKQIFIWDVAKGEQAVKPLTGHKDYVTSLSWEPFHKNSECRYLVSSSKDKTCRIWDTITSTCLKSLTGHTEMVTKVIWGGEDLIYSASRDTSIKVWNAKKLKLSRELKGHAHWVNTLALNTDYALRTACFDHTQKEFASKEEMKQYALERYTKAKGDKGHERLVSGSDDYTLFLWEPFVSKKPIARMTGHQQLINQVAFSPCGQFFVSASFDQSIKLWDGTNGKFMHSFRAHVGRVYQVAWSADSRLLVSGSKDTTLKVWDIKRKKLMFDLPGHADEVYAVDWSPDGEKVASGSKDRRLRIWKN